MYFIEIDTGEYDLVDGSIECHGPYDTKEEAIDNMRLKFKMYMSHDYDIVDRQKSFNDGSIAEIIYTDDNIMPMKFNVRELKYEADADIADPRHAVHYVMPIRLEGKTFYCEIIWCYGISKIPKLHEALKDAYLYGMNRKEKLTNELVEGFIAEYGWQQYSPYRKLKTIFDQIFLNTKMAKLVKSVTIVEPLDIK